MKLQNASYTQGDSNVSSFYIYAIWFGFRRHIVGKNS